MWVRAQLQARPRSPRAGRNLSFFGQKFCSMGQEQHQGCTVPSFTSSTLSFIPMEPTADQQRLECGKSPVERRFYFPLNFSFKGIMAPFPGLNNTSHARSLISAISNISAQRWDLSNCMKIISSGVPFSAKYSSVAPQCILNDPVVPQESWPLVSCRHQMQV